MSVGVLGPARGIDSLFAADNGDALPLPGAGQLKFLFGTSFYDELYNGLTAPPAAMELVYSDVDGSFTATRPQLVAVSISVAASAVAHVWSLGINNGLYLSPQRAYMPGQTGTVQVSGTFALEVGDSFRTYAQGFGGEAPQGYYALLVHRLAWLRR